MTMPEDTLPTSDEKMLGAVAHIFGPLIAIVLWMIQKDKSRFVKFQALQALVFDIIVIMVVGVLFFCLFGVAFLGMFGSIITAVNASPSSDQVAPFLFMPMMLPFLMFACMFPISFIVLAIRLVAGLSVLNGRNYHYPLIGKWLENFLAQ